MKQRVKSSGEASSRKRLAIVLIIAAFVIAFVCPIFVALATGTYRSKDIQASLVGSEKADHSSVKHAIQILESLNSKVDSVRKKLEEGKLSANEFRAEYDELEKLQRMKTELAKEYSVVGQANSVARVYFFTYFCLLGLTLLSFNFDGRGLIFVRTASPWAILFYLLFAPTNWIRNSSMGNEGRRLFSYAHLDISLWGFAYQEFQTALMMVLAGLVAACALEESSRWTMHFSRDLSYDELSRSATTVENELRMTQIRIFLTGCGFMPWSYFYWQASHSLSDGRYLASAVLLQTVWLLVWGLLIRHALQVLEYWQSVRTAVLCGTSNVDNSVKLLDAINPVASSTVVSTVTISTLSFLFPILKSLFE